MKKATSFRLCEDTLADLKFIAEEKGFSQRLVVEQLIREERASIELLKKARKGDLVCQVTELVNATERLSIVSASASPSISLTPPAISISGSSFDPSVKLEQKVKKEAI